MHILKRNNFNIHSVTADASMSQEPHKTMSLCKPAHFSAETFSGYSCLQHHVIKFLSFSALERCLT